MHRALLAIVIAVGLALRIAAAPYSTGSDIPQFAGFADTFLRHGACFYSFADSEHSEEEGWPYNWPYLYGPVWAYILATLRLAAPSQVEFYWEGSNYYVYVGRSWIVAVKSVLIAADTAVALLIYRLASRRSRRLGVFLAAAYYLNPMTIYISSIYGMFDQLALLPLLAALLYMDDKPRMAGALAGLSFMVKQTMGPPTLALAIYAWRRGSLRVFAAAAIAAAAATALPLLLLCPSSAPKMLELMTEAPEPSYTRPLVYSFNGLSSLATYLHDKCSCNGEGLDTLWMIKYWWVPAAFLALLALPRIAREDDAAVAAALAYTIFTATYWRVNHQYLVPLVALLLLSLPRLGRRLGLLAFITTLWAGFWPIAFPTSWWFHVHIKNPDLDVWKIVDRLTLMIFDEAFYVEYSLILTGLQYLLLVAATYRYAPATYGRLARAVARALGSMRKRIVFT